MSSPGPTHGCRLPRRTPTAAQLLTPSQPAFVKSFQQLWAARVDTIINDKSAIVTIYIFPNVEDPKRKLFLRYIQGAFFNCSHPKISKYKKKTKYPNCSHPKISKYKKKTKYPNCSHPKMS